MPIIDLVPPGWPETWGGVAKVEIKRGRLVVHSVDGGVFVLR
jgi:hypothetical protein